MGFGHSSPDGYTNTMASRHMGGGGGSGGINKKTPFKGMGTHRNYHAILRSSNIRCVQYSTNPGGCPLPQRCVQGCSLLGHVPSQLSHIHCSSCTHLPIPSTFLNQVENFVGIYQLAYKSARYISCTEDASFLTKPYEGHWFWAAFPKAAALPTLWLLCTTLVRVLSSHQLIPSKPKGTSAISLHFHGKRLNLC